MDKDAERQQKELETSLQGTVTVGLIGVRVFVRVCLLWKEECISLVLFLSREVTNLLA